MGMTMTLSRFLESSLQGGIAHALATIRRFPEQYRVALRESARVPVPTSYRGVEQIVVVGMGGSGLGAHIIQSALADRIRLPFTIVNDYALPGFVDRNTLVIASSYSGSTEETLAAYDAARACGAKVMAITTGGVLAKRAARDRVPCYRFTPSENPSGQPRLGTGYLAFGLVGLLKGAHVLHVPTKELRDAAIGLRPALERMERDGKIVALARALRNRIPLLITAEHLAGALHVFQNELHENAKHTAVSFLLPELNHHLLEGLRFPTSNPRALHAVLVASTHYHPRTSRRLEITETVLRKQRIPATVIAMPASNRLGEALALTGYGAYLSLALAATHRTDPTPVPWVDFLKKRLTNE